MPTAFLSHSSLDKDIVEKVFTELGASHAHYDAATFDVGERSAANIYSALSRTDLFVLFVSPASIQSKWVQSELAIAEQKFFGGQIRQVLVFLLNDAAPEQLPSWLRDHVYQCMTNPKLVSKAIRTKLLDIAVAAGSESHFFVGRDRDLASLKGTLAKVSSVTPDVIFLAGTEGIGRRSLVRKAFQETFPWLSRSPVEIVLSGHQGEIEFFRELLSYGPALPISQLLPRLEEFEKSSEDARTGSLSTLIASVVEQKQTIVLKGHESVIRDDGNIQDWLRRLIFGLRKHSYPQLIVISRRMVPAGKQTAYPNVHFVAVQSLSRDHTRDLLSLWLKLLGADFPAPLVEKIAEPVRGHPKNTEIAARYAAEVGVVRIQADQADFLDLIGRHALALIDTIKLSDVQQHFLALFREYEYLSADDILTASEVTDAEVESALGHLQEHGLVEKDGRHLRLAPYLADAVSRQKQDASIKAFLQRVERKFVDLVNTIQGDDLVEISTVDKVILSALRTGAEIPPLFSRVLLPSQQLRVAREFYDDQNFQRAAELFSSALDRRTLLTVEAQIMALRYLALALARRGEAERFYAVLEQFRRYDERVAKREESYLRGFKLRREGQLDQAEYHFREAYRLGGDRNFHVLRELSQVLLAKDEFIEAEQHARAALRIAPRNSYVLDILLGILIEKNRNRPQALTDDTDIARLFSVLEETARGEERSFYESRQAHFHSVLKNPVESLAWADKAVRVTPNLVPVRTMQLRALLDANRLPEARERLREVQKLVATAGSDGDRRFRFEIDQIHVRLDIAQGDYRGAKQILDRAVNMPGKIRQTLRRELAQAIAYANNSDTELVRWANDTLSGRT